MAIVLVYQKENEEFMKSAIIFGATGQDGAYLAAHLIREKIKCILVRRSTSTDNLSNLRKISKIESIDVLNESVFEHGDLIDAFSIIRIISKYKPNYVFNLAAQSHVGVSFETPVYTAMVDGLGVLHILEAIRNYSPSSRFYQASTSELFGGQYGVKLDETTKFDPRSPYAAAKMYAFNITKIYREAYGLFASNGILFNHESPLRGEYFVTQKIVKGLVRKAKLNRNFVLQLGNLNAKRDWGHASEYVKAMVEILSINSASDYVIGTGKAYSIKEFCELVCKELNIKNYYWEGKGINEKLIWPGYQESVAIKINEKYFRPLEVDHLLADPSKAEKDLKWKANIRIEQLVNDMVNHELNNV